MVNSVFTKLFPKAIPSLLEKIIEHKIKEKNNAVRKLVIFLLLNKTPMRINERPEKKAIISGNTMLKEE